MARVEWVMQLNNFLQSRPSGTKGLQWIETPPVPLHCGNWNVTCRINNKQYGSGKAAAKKDARELAAKETMKRLSPELHNKLIA